MIIIKKRIIVPKNGPGISAVILIVYGKFCSTEVEIRQRFSKRAIPQVYQNAPQNRAKNGFLRFASSFLVQFSASTTPPRLKTVLTNEVLYATSRILIRALCDVGTIGSVAGKGKRKQV